MIDALTVHADTGEPSETPTRRVAGRARVRPRARLSVCVRVTALCVQIQPQNIVTYGTVHAVRTVGVFE